MANKRTLIVSDDGSIQLPDWFREKYNVKPGDEIGFLETEAGLLVAPRAELVNQLLDQIGADLKAKGITLEDLMASGREIRGEILREKYGIDPSGRFFDS
jgi:bifunctional DNA-binding transcriptional regulator/antitoxin component of YhaV-PrlF toxin-antitoxin module